MLVLAGAGALTRMVPISLAIAALVIVVVSSYRQTVRAYPQGGGAYLVTRDNLGHVPARIAASALMIDYILTVAVSVTAGVAAVASAFPSLISQRVLITIGLVLLPRSHQPQRSWETGRLFTVPTYLFFGMVISMLGVGFARSASIPPRPCSVPA